MVYGGKESGVCQKPVKRSHLLCTQRKYQRGVLPLLHLHMISHGCTVRVFPGAHPIGWLVQAWHVEPCPAAPGHGPASLMSGETLPKASQIGKNIMSKHRKDQQDQWGYLSKHYGWCARLCKDSVGNGDEW